MNPPKIKPMKLLRKDGDGSWIVKEGVDQQNWTGIQNGQFIGLTEISSTRRVFLQGDDFRRLVELLQKQMKVSIRLEEPDEQEMVISSRTSKTSIKENRAIIHFGSSVLTSKIQKLIDKNGLELNISVSIIRSKKLNKCFLYSIPYESNSSNQQETQSFISSSTNVSSYKTPVDEIYEEKIEDEEQDELHTNSQSQMISDSIETVKKLENQFNIQGIVQNIAIEFGKQQQLIQKIQKGQQQQQQFQKHVCSSIQCCTTLFEMAINGNESQITRHLCKQIMKNGWRRYQLMKYVENEVPDSKLNEQIFHVIAENAQEITNAIQFSQSDYNPTPIQISNSCNCQRNIQTQLIEPIKKDSSSTSLFFQQSQHVEEQLTESSECNFKGQQFMRKLSFSEEGDEEEEGNKIKQEENQLIRQIQQNPLNKMMSHPEINYKERQEISIKKHVKRQTPFRSPYLSPIPRKRNQPSKLQ